MLLLGEVFKEIVITGGGFDTSEDEKDTPEIIKPLLGIVPMTGLGIQDGAREEPIKPAGEGICESVN